MKVLVGMLAHEANSFASRLGTFDLWAPSGWLEGDEILRSFEDTADFAGYIGGMVRAAREVGGVELIPTVSLNNAAPTLSRETVDYTVGVLLSYVEKYKDELDGICICLHGAGAAEGIDDLESYTLTKIREIVGYDMPITVPLDLHGNITEDMVRLSDGLFGCKEYPHTDMAVAGYNAMKALLNILGGGERPTTVLRKLPLMVAPGAGTTTQYPMKEFKDHVAQYVTEHGLIDATLFHGFCYADVPCVGASIVTVADRAEDAEKAADELAQWVWDNREKLIPECLSPEEAVDRALEELSKPGGGFVVINETSDNPGGGTPGDGTGLLREFFRRDLEGAIFGYIYDRDFACMAHEVGVGGLVSGLLGGKTDNKHGAPIEVKDALVLSLCDGNTAFISPVCKGLKARYGKMARLRLGKVEFIVAENLCHQTYDDRPFLITGADINGYRILGLKSTAHFKAFFRPLAKAIITTDPPGIQTNNFNQMPFQRIKRPMFPLDPDTVWELPGK
ncbi:MAG: M81 family metallopeptidase [Ruminococcaceae bacterium]|nr:M81 family metallopeptidase [Oscillospiraceae bacterium]